MSGFISLESSEISVSESDGVARIVIVREGDDSQPVTVNFETITGSAGPADFTGIAGTVTIPAGQDRVVVEIPINNDTLSEATEDFSISLSNVSSGALQFPRTATVSILDDENPVTDPPVPPLVSDFDVTPETVFTGIDRPIAFEFSPDDGKLMYVAEKNGRITLRDTETGEIVSTVLDLRPEVNDRQDRGLLDIALHPDFENNPYLYTFYTVDPPEAAGLSGNAGREGGGNRFSWLVRWELDPATGYSSVVSGSKTIMLGGAGQTYADVAGGGAVDSTNNISIRSSERDPDTGEIIQDYLKVDSRSHAGGSIEFGPDGALYVSTGDGTSFGTVDPRTVDVQNINSLSGKILRIDPVTGEGLADNPFFTGDAGENASKVYQLGLRNPFSMSFDAEGQLIISDTGWNNWEEINVGGPGANFGWPFYEGGDLGQNLKTSRYQDLPEAAGFYTGDYDGVLTPAFRAFSHRSNDPGFQVQAITGADDVIRSDLYPLELQNHYIFTDVSQSEVYAVSVNDRRDVKFLYQSAGGTAPVHYKQGPDGKIYFADLATGEIGTLSISGGQPAMTANYFETGTGIARLADIDFDRTPDLTATVSSISASDANGSFFSGARTDNFAVQYTGTFTVETAGVYTFFLGSDDGSVLFINGAPVIDNDELHSFRTENGVVDLTAGTQTIEVRYFEAGGAARIELDWSGPEFARKPMRFFEADRTLIEGTPGNDFLLGTAGADLMLGNGGQDVFANSLGDDTLIGDAGEYDQVDYDGGRDDYVFTENPDGTVTVEGALTGTDTLTSVEGVWFRGAGEWVAISTLVAEDLGGPITGTSGNDRLNGTPLDDVMIGLGGVDVFVSSPGDDEIYGFDIGSDDGNYDQVDYADTRDDYIFTENADGTITVTGALTGTDTLTGIEGVWFFGSAEWVAVTTLVAEDASGPIRGTAGRDSLSGTAGDDVMFGLGDFDVFQGSLGNDQIFGFDDTGSDDGAYDQVDYAGSPGDYSFTRNADGSVTVTGALTGTDTLTSIEGIWFQGSAEWRSVESLVSAPSETVPAQFGNVERVELEPMAANSAFGAVMTGVSSGWNWAKGKLAGLFGQAADVAAVGADTPDPLSQLTRQDHFDFSTPPAEAAEPVRAETGKGLISAITDFLKSVWTKVTDAFRTPEVETGSELPVSDGIQSDSFDFSVLSPQVAELSDDLGLLVMMEQATDVIPADETAQILPEITRPPAPDWTDDQAEDWMG